MGVRAWYNFFVFNAPFKRKINDFSTQHLQEHLEEYLHGKFSAEEHRVLIPKQIGETWEAI